MPNYSVVLKRVEIFRIEVEADNSDQAFRKAATALINGKTENEQPIDEPEGRYLLPCPEDDIKRLVEE